MEKVKFNFNDYSLSELYSKFKIIGTHFYPFNDNSYYLEEEDDYKNHIESLMYSTVYKGIRYEFDNPKDLKSFCEMVEASND